MSKRATMQRQLFSYMDWSRALVSGGHCLEPRVNRMLTQHQKLLPGEASESTPGLPHVKSWTCVSVEIYGTELHAKTCNTVMCNTTHGNISHSSAAAHRTSGRLYRKQCSAKHYAKLDNTSLSSNAAHDTHAWEKSHD